MGLDVEARRRAMVFLTSHLLGPWLGLVVIGFLHLIDPAAGMLLALPAAAVCLFWVFPFVLRATGNFIPLALASLQNLTFVVLFISFFYGGLSSPFLPWLITIPVLAFLYFGEKPRLRALALGGLAVNVLVFYAARQLQGSFQSRVLLEALSTAGFVSIFCAGFYVTVMAMYYSRILASRSELEREVLRHQQTAVLLVEAKEAAEAGDRAKSEFLATMSHELRTPLNAVIGLSEIMSRGVYGPIGHANYENYIRDIHASGSHLLDIINDILAVSQAAECGIEELTEGTLDCHELLEASSRLVRSRLVKANLTLELDAPADLPQLRADVRMVKQVLLHLLTNAIKFTPAGGRIDVSLVADRQDGLTVTVRDTGIGIAKADLKRIRDPFVQVDSSFSRRSEGAGLGLPIVDMMLRRHGGTLEIDSVLGKGTAVRVRLPIDRLIWPADREGETAADLPGSGRENGTIAPPMRKITHKPRGDTLLLVVEDDPNLQELIRRMLDRMGFATAVANNGREALSYLQTAPVDLVITDMVMPEMDGVELMRVLQKECPGMPIIALSGVEKLVEYRNIATHLGARAALRKPITRAELSNALTEVLGY